MKVSLDGNITKFKIIRNTHKLKDSDYDGISIKHDLTKEQRKELKELIDLAKKKEQEDPMETTRKETHQEVPENSSRNSRSRSRSRYTRNRRRRLAAPTRFNGSHGNEKINCWYTNADSLRNKMEELKLRLQLADKKPEIIMITEVKPKNSKYSLSEAELSLENYHLITLNIDTDYGRSIAVYVKKGLRFSEVEMKSEFQESLWIFIRLKYNHSAFR